MFEGGIKCSSCRGVSGITVVLWDNRQRLAGSAAKSSMRLTCSASQRAKMPGSGRC